MEELQPTSFFDLSLFEHQALFDCLYVWESLKKIHDYLLSLPLGKIDVDVPQGTVLVNSEQISIGEGTIIEPGAYIRGPCFIGKNSTIRQGAYIRGDVIAGNRVVIGHCSEAKNAIFFNGSQAPHFSYIGDSILGNQVNLGAGTICSNFRLDHGLITVYLEHQRFETELKKMGAIIGDHSQVGCNSVTNPGTLIGKNVHCYPGVNIGGYIPPQSIVKNANKAVITALGKS